MQCTDILSSEHRVIERFITALRAAADRLAAGDEVRRGFFLDATSFIREYADGLHHGKEEGVLFAAMARAGMPTDRGPIGVMLHEHDLGRECTSALRRAAEQWAAGEAAAGPAIIQCARAYADLLGQHIQKEDRILFAMADEVIPADEADDLLEAFAAVERERGTEAAKASYVALARMLCAEMDVDPDLPLAATGGIDCHAHCAAAPGCA